MSHAAAAPEIEVTLALAERCLTSVAQALLQGHPDMLEAAARELQQTAQVLSGVLARRPEKSSLDRKLRQRLGNVAASMAMQREACVRRAAVVERSLHSIIPATRPSTYAGAAAPYARTGKQNGAFRAFS